MMRAVAPALEKIYLLFDHGEASAPEALREMLPQILPYANVNANLYLILTHPPAGPGAADGLDVVFTAVTEHLRAHPFVRFFLHLVHPVAGNGMSEVERFYDRLKQTTRFFDREGYRHQEVPRLMLLPLVLPRTADRPALSSFLGSLRRAFLPPSLCLMGVQAVSGKGFAADVGAEKIYWGAGSPGRPADVLSSLLRQDIVDESCARLAAEMAVNSPCAQSFIMSLKNGRIYACLDAFEKQSPVAVMEEGLDVAALMGDYERRRPSGGRCPACRERLCRDFSAFPLARETKEELGALFYHFGTLHENRHRLEEAVSSYRDSLRLSPASEADAVSFRLGLCHTMAGAYGEALDIFENIRSAYAQAHFYHFYTGLCRFHQGDYPTALEAFLEAETLAPPGEDLTRILIYAGTCYNYLGRYRDGLRPLKKARDLDGGVKEVWSTLGFSYFQLKEYDSAIAHLEKAVELDPDSAVDYASLGANYREKGDAATAVAMFEKALSLDPGMTAARENLERLGHCS